MSKGSNRRPSQATREEFERRWECAFAPKPTRNEVVGVDRKGAFVWADDFDLDYIEEEG